MHGMMDVWNWFWMGFMIVSWVVVTCVLGYIVLQLTTHGHARHSKEKS